jgi:hypothetical protein
MEEYFLSPTDSGWADSLRKLPHDVYHFPQYASLCAGIDGGTARAFLACEGGCRFFLPLIVRDVPTHLSGGERISDVTGPYGYAGPLVSCDPGVADSVRDGFLHRALGRLVEALRRERYVSAFIRLHPLFPIETRALNDFGTVVQSGETVAIDLTLSEECLWRQIRSNHRRDVTRTMAGGAVAAPDATWLSLPAFIDAYRETMIRVGASSYYQFPDRYFTELREALRGRVHLWTVATGGEVMAGALFTEWDGIVQYHLGGTRDQFLPHQPLKLLFHSAIQWFKTRGHRWLHLGGGVGSARDSLFHFKLGFSPCIFPFHTWRLLLDTTAYHELLTRARRQGTGTQPLQFFPEYRQGPASEPVVTVGVTNTP